MPKTSSEKSCKLEIKIGFFTVNADGKAPVWLAAVLALTFIILLLSQVSNLNEVIFSGISYIRQFNIQIK